MALTQIADVIIDGKPYMLPRGNMGRVWQEDGPQAAEIRQELSDVARGGLGNEFRISWTSKHRGFGEPVRRVEGRDYWGRNVDKRYPGQVTLARAITEITPSVTAGADPTGFATLGSTLYCSYGAYVLKLNPATEAESGTYNASTTTDIAVFQNKLFLARGNSLAFQHSTDGTVWNNHSGSLTAFRFESTINRLYRLSKKAAGGTVSSYLSNNSVDPTDNINWSAEDAIGDPEVPGTQLASLGYQMFIAKEDGLYAADIQTGLFPTLTPELAAWRSVNNGVGMYGWGGLLFLPTIRGTKIFYAGTLVTAGPEVMGQNDSEVKGRITAMAGDANWVFAAQYNGTNTYILAGRPASGSDAYPGEIVWSVIWYLAGGPWTAMAVVSSSTEPKLVLARQDKVAFIKLGISLDNPLQDATAIYGTTGEDYYPAHDGGSPLVDKHFLELRVFCEELNRAAGRHIKWSYRLDDTTTWTVLGTTRDSPVSVLKFDQAADVIGRRIALKAEWTRGTTTTKTPVLRHVEVLGVEYPPERKVLSFQVLAEDNLQLRQGTDSRRWDQILSDLSAVTVAKRKVGMVDPAGRKYTVLPLAPVLLRELASSDTRGLSGAVTCRFLVV